MMDNATLGFLVSRINRRNIEKEIRRWALPPYPELSIAFFGQSFRHGADNGTVQFEDTAIAPNLQV